MKTKIALVLSTLFCLQAHAAAIDPDPSFGYAGRALAYYDLAGGKSDIMRDTAVVATTGAIYSVGSVEISGNRQAGALVKRLANGATDTAFASGSSWLSFASDLTTGSAQFNAVAFDTSNTGAVFAGGWRDTWSGRCAYVVKVLDNSVMKGALDGSFSYSGSWTVCNGSGSGAPAEFTDIKVQADGKILLLYKNSPLADVSTLYRLMPNGALDTSFNAGRYRNEPGAFVVDARVLKSETADRIAITNQGILVGGSSQYNGNDWDGYVIRVQNNGVIDSTFGSNGVHFLALDDPNTQNDDRVADLIADSTGKAIVLMNSNSGVFPTNGAQNGVRVIRLNAQGVRDSSFATNGIAYSGLSDTTASSAGNFSYTIGAALAINGYGQIWTIGSLVQVVPGVTIRSMLAASRMSSAGALININNVMPYGLDEYGVSASMVNNAVLIGSKRRTTTLVTDFDFGFLRLLGTP